MVVVVVVVVVVGLGGVGVDGLEEVEGGSELGWYRDVVLSNVCTLLKVLKWLLVEW